jgi:DNA-binding transcriptional regulator YiaG
MKRTKRKKLEALGWRVGSAAEFLHLSPEEAALGEMKLGLSLALKRRRVASALSQEALAKLLGSSQSRVAKMEAGHGPVSIELLLRGLLVLGATPREVAKALVAA